MNTRRLISLGTTALLLTVVGCGGGGNGGTGGTTGKGGSGGKGGTGAANQTSDYAFTLSPTALSLPLGGMQAVTVTIDRNTAAATFTGPITFALEIPNTITGAGVTAEFTPNPATAATTTLAVDIGTTGVTAGSYTLQVVGTSGADTYTVDLPLTVTAPASTLLVDADYTANNLDPTDVTATPSPSDTLFPSLLQHEAVSFNTFVVPSNDTVAASVPAIADLTGYSTIVWYTGAAYGGIETTVSPAQQAILEAWLDQGNHTLLIFSQNLVYDLRQGDWNSTPETNTFLTSYIGAIGSSDDGPTLDHATYVVTGATGTAFAGEAFQVIMDQPLSSTGDVINPAAGTDVLGTVVENPDGVLAAAAAVPIVVGRKLVGAAHTSTVLYAGMPIENVLMTTGNNTTQQFFHACLTYTGL